MAQDPVCNMEVSSDSPHNCRYADETYYFCSEHCLHKFRENPEGFVVEKPAPPPETAGSSNAYTCPMHPEVMQDHPGPCPKCGMALEPVAGKVEEKNEELLYMSRRFWAGLAMSLPLLMLAMVADLLPAWLLFISKPQP